MKPRTLPAVAGCLLAAACGGPPPAPSGPAPAIDLRLDPPPVHALLGEREALGLSSEQIDALDAVGQQVHAENHPLLLQVRELDEGRRHPLARDEILRLAGRIHVNNHQAMERVRGILTERQRTDTCAASASSRTTARGLRTVAQGGPAGPLGTVGPPATVLQLGSHPQHGPVWSWCHEGAARAAAGG